MSTGFIVHFVKQCNKYGNFNDAFIAALKEWAVSKIDNQRSQILNGIDVYDDGAEIQLEFDLKMNGTLIKQLRELCEQQ